MSIFFHHDLDSIIYCNRCLLLLILMGKMSNGAMLLKFLHNRTDCCKQYPSQFFNVPVLFILIMKVNNQTMFCSFQMKIFSRHYIQISRRWCLTNISTQKDDALLQNCINIIFSAKKWSKLPFRWLIFWCERNQHRLKLHEGWRQMQIGIILNGSIMFSINFLL